MDAIFSSVDKKGGRKSGEYEGEASHSRLAALACSSCSLTRVRGLTGCTCHWFGCLSSTRPLVPSIRSPPVGRHNRCMPRHARCAQTSGARSKPTRPQTDSCCLTLSDKQRRLSLALTDRMSHSSAPLLLCFCVGLDACNTISTV